MLLVLVAILSLLAGYYARELSNRLLRIEKAATSLLVRQKKEEQQDKKMSFADPTMTMEQYLEMEEEERLDALNQMQ